MSASASRSAVGLAMRHLRRRRSLILCYHGVGSSSVREDPHWLQVPVERFRRQLGLLVAAGFEFVTVGELVERAAGAGPPPGMAALTFDDGMEDNHSVVMPLLRDLGIPATVYVRTDVIGRPNPAMGASSGARMMTEAQLRDLVAAGFEIGAHTVNHVDLSTADFDTCLREMTESRATLERITGTPVRTFAYPYCKYGDAAVAAARRAGFTAAVTCHGRGSWDAHELKRAMITGKDGTAGFLLKAADVYQPLFDSVPGRVLRSATRVPRRWARLRLERRR